MQLAKLLHNPGAGDEAYNEQEISALVEEGGFKYSYSSVKEENWKDIDQEADLIILSGGDGTIRKVAKFLLDSEQNKKFPIALLPAGTANNIAKTLNINGSDKEIISSWHKKNLKAFDVGEIYDVPGVKFFLESFGCGVFPILMNEMKKQDEKELDTPEKKLKMAVKLLHEIIQSYEPQFCHIEIDGTDHSGKFLLVEVMNTRSIGPNLVLSPHADPGDGEFEVVLIPESQKEKFSEYIESLIKESEEPFMFDVCKAKNITIKSNKALTHVDDEVIEEHPPGHIRIELKEGLLDFFIQQEI